MPIKTTPFVNPFRNIVTEKGDTIIIEKYKGKEYQRVVRKK